MASELELRLSTLKHGDHICPIHDRAEAGFSAIAPFVSDGLNHSEQCLVVADTFDPVTLGGALKRMGVELDREVQRNSLKVLRSEDCFLKSGRFNPQEMIDFMSRAQDAARASGFKGMRFAGVMAWLARAQVEPSQLIEYEMLLNQFLEKSDSLVLCQYQRSSFDDAQFHDVLRSHPVVVLNNLACTNPYYEMPELMLNPSRAETAEFKRKRVEWWIRRLFEARNAEQEMLRLRDEVRQAHKMESLGSLAGGIAHDFNNLLTIINGYCELLLRRMPQADPSIKYLREISAAGTRSAALTRQLLAFSRKQVVLPRLIDVNTVVTEMETMLRRILGEDVEFMVSKGASLGSVNTDPAQIEQIIMNLVVNARDAMPEGGRLEIQSANIDVDAAYAAAHQGIPAGNYVLLSVTDSGLGMSAETLEHIYEPFFTTKEEGKGTGMGLSLVHGAVTQLGGCIEVVSRIGSGTTFKIYLPRQVAPPSVAADKAPATHELRGTETVLLVEDDRALGDLTRQVLEDAGYTVLKAGNGIEALRLAQSHKGALHLLLTDVVLPSMGGRQLAERMQLLHPEARVLFVSGYANDSILRTGINRGSLNFLAKPFSCAALQAKIRALLDLPKTPPEPAPCLTS